MKQTICRKLNYLSIQNTIQINHLFTKTSLLRKNVCISNLFNKLVYKAINWNLKFIITNYLPLLVRKSVLYVYNPQITKARIIFKHLYKSYFILRIGLSMLVGISEAIRLLFFNTLNKVSVLLALFIKLVYHAYGFLNNKHIPIMRSNYPSSLNRIRVP